VPDHYGETLDFIQKVIGSLAWPILVYVLARMFREQIGRIVQSLADRLGMLTEWPGFGARAVFGGTVTDIERARVEVSSVPSTGPPAPPP